MWRVQTWLNGEFSKSLSAHEVLGQGLHSRHIDLHAGGWCTWGMPFTRVVPYLTSAT